MKTFNNIIFSLLLIIIFSFPAVVQGQNKDSKDTSSRISTKYDKSKNLTTVRLKQFTITKIGQEKVIANNIPLHQMDLEIFFSYSGQEIAKQVEDVSLHFHTVANNYIFLKGQPVIAVLNREIQGQDRALGLGTTDYKSGAPKYNSVYEENLSLKIPADAFVKMANANTLEIYVGPVNYQLTPDQCNAIKELAGRLSVTSSIVLPGSVSIIDEFNFVS